MESKLIGRKEELTILKEASASDKPEMVSELEEEELERLF